MLHLEMSGIVLNELQPININEIFITLFVSHLDISGIEFNNEHP